MNTTEQQRELLAAMDECVKVWRDGQAGFVSKEDDAALIERFILTDRRLGDAAFRAQLAFRFARPSTLAYGGRS